MLLKSCAHCGALIPYGRRYCATCEPIMQAKRAEYIAKRRAKYDKKYDVTRRDPKYYDFYHSPAWRALAAAYMAQRGYRCERCGKIAEQVHHRVPIKTPEGWARRLDDTNLELLCIACHNAEHKRFCQK